MSENIKARRIAASVGDQARIEGVARAFHESYEMFAPAVGWETQTPVPWTELPQDNRRLMLVVITDLLNRGIIRA